MKKRIAWIDIAKGICIISVIAGHEGDELANKIVFAYHLTVFFLLSGYTMKAEYNRDTLNKRFASLMVPYFITCFCIMCMNVINSVILDRNGSVAVVTEMMGTDLLKTFWASGAATSFQGFDIGGRIGAIWFLPAMFFATWIVQAVLRYVPEKRLQYAAVGLIAVAGSISNRFVLLPFAIQPAMFAAPFVLLGYRIREKNLLDQMEWKHFVVCLALCLIGIVIGISEMSFVTSSAPDILLSSLFSIASSFVIIYIAKKIEWCKPLEFIGRNSLIILCVHLLDMTVIGNYTWLVYEWLGLPYTFWARFLQDLFWIAVVTAAVLFVKKAFSSHKKHGNCTADRWS